MSLNKSQALNTAKQYVLQRNVRAAVEIYREIIEADPTDLDAINTLGDLFLSTGRPQEAIAQFSRVAVGYIEGGHTRKAIATLKKMIVSDPSNIETAIKLADLYAQAGLPSEARQHYLQISEALTRKGQTSEALIVYRKTVDLDPSNTSGRIKLGELYLREGMNDQAYEAFVTAADQLAAKSENRRALNAYNEALAIRPDNQEVLAKARKTLALLGVADPDKSLRESISKITEPAGSTRGSDSAALATDLPVDSPAPDLPSSDIFVVNEISKAEILVAYGQVNKAITMLADVLRARPDNIDVHIKLKDIYLRTGMMAEAGGECIELQRIHEARGESERARDYAVRASRLTQSLEHPSGDLPEPTRKRAPSPRVEAARTMFDSTAAAKARPVATRLEPRTAQPVRATVSTAPLGTPAVEAKKKPVPAPAPVPNPRPVITKVEAPTVEAKKEPVPAPILDPRPVITRLETPAAQPSRVTFSVAPSEPRVVEAIIIPASDPPQEILSSPVEALVQVSASEMLSVPSRESALTLTTHKTVETLPALLTISSPVKRRRGLVAAAVAAGVIVLLGGSAVIGGFAYDSHLDKQYQALLQEAPALAVPVLVPDVLSEETPPTQENEQLMVVVTPGAQNEAPAERQRIEREPIRNEAPPPAPQPVVEQPKVTTRSASVPPRVAVSSDNAASENRTPTGLPVNVPIGSSPPVEPPPKAVRQSPGVVLGAALKRVEAVYPPAARQARLGGAVAVEVNISEQGNVTSARAISGPALLRNAAVMAAQGWKFKASTLGGVPVKTTTTIVFNFRF